VDRAASIIFDVTKGLKHAHRQGIIHRDLKPLNILIKGKKAKISDWGLSKLRTSSKSSSAIAFSPLYAAPEHFSKTRFGKPDERTDIWQLGVIFYELVTGKTPFGGEDFTFTEISYSIINDQPVLASEINAESKPVEHIIMRCIAKQMDDRYQGVEDLQQELGEYLKLEYKKSLKQSVSEQNMKRSAFYCCELFLMCAQLNEQSDALKYCLDMANYSDGDVKREVKGLAEDLKFRLERGINIGEEFMVKAKVVVHQVRMGWR
jgi:serine/threonine protein kinase